MSFRLGDKVVIDHPRFKNAGVFTIIKINAKSYGVQNDAGQKVRVSPVFLVKSKSAPKSASMKPLKFTIFHPGQIVKVKSKNDPYVVLSQNAKSVSCAVLGGDGGRYLRVPASALTVIDL